MEAAFDHFERLLANTQEPLSFIIFIPEFKENVLDCVLKLDLSLYKRGQVTVNANDCELRNGFQHVCELNQLYFKSSVSLNIIFLQNESGFNKWGPTSERLDALLNSFKFGREMNYKDKEISILSPPPTPQTSSSPYSSTSTTSSTSTSASTSSTSTSSTLSSSLSSTLASSSTLSSDGSSKDIAHIKDTSQSSENVQ